MTVADDRRNLIESLTAAAAVLSMDIDHRRLSGDHLADRAEVLAQDGATVLSPMHLEWISGDVAALREKPDSRVNQLRLKTTMGVIFSDFRKVTGS